MGFEEFLTGWLRFKIECAIILIIADWQKGIYE
jgi:hypothetical protein